MNQTIHKEIKRNILLNPGPATTTASVKEALVVSDICPRESEFGDLISRVCRDLLKVCNADQSTYQTVLLGSSGTGAIESCLTSCTDPLSEKKILIIENGAYGLRMEQICQAYGISYDKIKYDWTRPIPVNELKSYLAEKAALYRVVSFVHHETTTGVLNPLEEIASLIKSHDLKVMVDAMSSYAGIVIDQSALKIDYLISSSNKCIQAMAGVGIVIASKAELEEISTFKKRSFYFDLTKNWISQTKGGQFAFTPPVQVLYSLEKGIEEFLREGGQEKRAKRYADLYSQMYEGMLAFGFKPVVEQKYHSKILTSFYYLEDDKFNFDQMHDFFYSRGVTIYPGKVGEIDSFRISNIGELNSGDISFFLELMKEYIQ